ncbi:MULTISPECIES: hypothetical protein [Pontibacillus]|uniref:GerMN domain-containing protein n=1 Tax=Pontibacillus chungwhensis TaxID=265426 RepID=A0ABY8USF1_9BACI|nr:MULTISPECIES: hypothetical protein [Pontibacillus]MCD5323034.1 hypothetical protein [Pontibacillus sp. HN14]WIF96427.1 hypothetical protein QNI29_11750 [Pontibacillus chungwhensis]
MKRNNHHNDDSIQDLLNRMPSVEDRQSSEELYRKISTKRFQHVQKRSKRKKALTAWGAGIASLAAIILFFVVAFPSMQMDNAQHDTASSNESMDASADQSTSEAHEYKEAKLQETEESHQSSDQSKSDMGNDSEQGFVATDSALSSQVVYREDNKKYATLPFADVQGQYIIPFTFQSVNDTQTVEQLYNSLSPSIQEDWGVMEYQFSSVSFNINQKERIVVAGFPEDYEFPGSSAQENIFLKSLKAMFRPLNIQTIDLQTNGEPGVDLGNNSGLKQIKLDGISVYKRFNSPNGLQLFVQVPINQSATVEEALNKLKVDEPNFNVEGTIPKEVEVMAVETTGDTLEVNVNGVEGLEQARYTLWMIESILMTAKEFGYQEVKFNGFPFERLGTYNFTKSLQVPFSVNPMPANQSYSK